MTFPSTYRRLVATKHSLDFAQAVEIEDVTFPVPKADEIVVRNIYAGVNASDLSMASGRYLFPTPVPVYLGAEAVGEVVQVGADVHNLKVGDFVLTNNIGSGYTEYYCGKARYSVQIPEAGPEIMSLSIGGLTASLALYINGQMSSGETVLVTAAAGGTGQFVVQLAKLAGNHVIGTCSSDEKADMLRALGCDRVINYREEDLGQVLKQEYPRGVDIVFESVGKDFFDAALRNLAPFGRLIVIGFISQYKDEDSMVQGINMYHLLRKNNSITAFNLNRYFGRPETAEHLMKLVALLKEGKLQVMIDPTEFKGVDSVVAALDYLYAGKNSGKVIIRF